ncbi:DMT family transporter [Nesterenkonia sp. HG001]|uniref:DMT family transporter n=1 Tax=Nesterenkonia sp. HG001 TaxID=2983207 RepID=UPI002AC3BCD4|nr:DMT family transporter [Nesterenkonia sp. HG001]MDZ5077584.1 DMT family transporter [Nesterenkonia sp. HG001]
MKEHSSDTVTIGEPLPLLTPPSGVWWGLLGVVAFSFTVPLTRIAVTEGATGGGLDPLFVGAGRAVVAGFLAGSALLLARQRLPQGRQWLRLGIVALGIVLGFPVLTSLALTTATANHGAVVIAVLPAATAVVAVVRTGERPGPLFWTATSGGAAAAVAFASVHGGVGSLHWTDLLFFAAVVTAAFGYAEGGLLARELGAWQTISWALVAALPVTILLTALSLDGQVPQASPAQWASFGYLAVVSMFLGFFAWYRGLAIGPIAQVSQIQLTQPVMTLIWATVLLGERITLTTMVGGLAVVLCAAAAVRVRLRSG